MSIIDYLVTASGIIERSNFYNYMHDLGYKDDKYTREEMINSTYPFAVCIKEKRLMIMESATLCYLSQTAGSVINVDEFKEIIESR